MTWVRAGRFESATFQGRPGLQSAPHPGRGDGVVIFLRKITTPSLRPAAGRASNHAAPTTDGSPSPWHCAIARLLLWNYLLSGYSVSSSFDRDLKAGPPISSSWEPVSTALRDSKKMFAVAECRGDGLPSPKGHTSETRWLDVFF